MALLQRLYKYVTRPAVDPAVAALYNACVAQARQAAFYETLGVPDSIDGRFDLLLVHVFLVMRRLGVEAEIKQSLFDLMFADMDRSLREMGIGDMSVGKKIKPMIMAFYGRAQAYEKALAEDDNALAVVLRRNLYGTTPVSADNPMQLAIYVRRAVAALDKQGLEDITEGKLEFPAVIVS
jgi:cytochrome b pre-mRNA-processing protein 3